MSNLSDRAQVYLGQPEFLMKCFIQCEQDLYNKDTNPSGMINLGTAVNALVEDLIADRLSRPGIFQHRPEWQHYYGLNGTPDLLDTAAMFLTKRLARDKRIISPANLRMVNGVSSGLEVFSWVLADPGDVILVPVPTYARFFADMNERMKTEVVGVHLDESPDCPFKLTKEILETEIERQTSLGKKVRGFIYCNPNNPLGAMYDKETTLELMRVCAKHQVHFISDEIYALSVFSPEQGQQFESVLSFTDDELPDPERTHFMWGLSKDFGLAGFRMAFIHTYSKELLTCLDGGAIYTCVPAHLQHVAGELLRDEEWLDNVYFPTNLARLQESYELVVKTLASLGVPVYKAKAGLFVWADFGAYLKTKSRESELELFRKFFNEDKLYLVPGSEFGCKKFGWFRIIFAVDKSKLQAALERLKTALK